RAGERGGAGLVRLVGARPLPGVDAPLPPPAVARSAAAAARHGVRGVGGDLLPALAGCGVRLRNRAARRRRRTQREALLAAVGDRRRRRARGRRGAPAPAAWPPRSLAPLERLSPRGNAARLPRSLTAAQRGVAWMSSTIACRQSWKPTTSASRQRMMLPVGVGTPVSKPRVQR